MKKITKSAFLFAGALLINLPYAQAEDTHAKSHWGYHGNEGPEHWGDIEKKYAACAEGTYQSPIDIKKSINAELAPLDISYKDTPLEILNNGHTIQVNYKEGSTLKVDGQTYNLLQFHFHTPSENEINGKRYEMELHFVHKRDDGQLGVLGVMIEEGQENKTAQLIWDHLPKHKADAETFKNITINGEGLLPDDKEYYRFMGSLTTPPCSEGVNWHVFAEPIQFSKNQIDAFKAIFPMNARPVQPQNNRLIVLDK